MVTVVVHRGPLEGTSMISSEASMSMNFFLLLGSLSQENNTHPCLPLQNYGRFIRCLGWFLIANHYKMCPREPELLRVIDALCEKTREWENGVFCGRCGLLYSFLFFIQHANDVASITKELLLNQVLCYIDMLRKCWGNMAFFSLKLI